VGPALKGDLRFTWSVKKKVFQSVKMIFTFDCKPRKPRKNKTTAQDPKDAGGWKSNLQRGLLAREQGNVRITERPWVGGMLVTHSNKRA